MSPSSLKLEYEVDVDRKGGMTSLEHKENTM